MPILTDLDLDQLRSLRRHAQRLAELGAGLHWCDVAADVDAEISRRTQEMEDTTWMV